MVVRLKFFFIILITILVLLYFIPFKTQNFNAIYGKKDHFLDSIENFRKKPLNKIEIDGVIWNYYVSGQGDKCLLFIHGMGGAYDFWWSQIQFFQMDYKIISYTLPTEINSLEKTEKGIIAILNREKVDKFIPIGTSMGGYIAQYLTHIHPNRVEKVVLGNTFPPNDFIKKENKVKRNIIPLLPSFLVGKLGEDHLKKDIFPSSENNELLKSFLLSVPFSKKKLAGRFDIVTDYFKATPDISEIKSIPKLIFESDNDPMISPRLRSDLKKLYPDAEIYTFHNKGHFPYINAMEEYNLVLKTFLEK